MRKIGVDHDIAIDFYGLISGRPIWNVEGGFFRSEARQIEIGHEVTLSAVSTKNSRSMEDDGCPVRDDRCLKEPASREIQNPEDEENAAAT
jgi:hypothetical protein